MRKLLLLVALCGICACAGYLLSFTVTPQVQAEAVVSVYSEVPRGANFNARYFFDGLEMTLRRQTELDRIERRSTYLFSVQRPSIDALTLHLRERGPNEAAVREGLRVLERYIQSEMKNRIDGGDMKVVMTPRWVVQVEALRPARLIFAIYGCMVGLVLFFVRERLRTDKRVE